MLTRLGILLSPAPLHESDAYYDVPAGASVQGALLVVCHTFWGHFVNLLLAGSSVV